MPWCPKCLYIYREGFNHCSDCDMELVMGEIPLDANGDPAMSLSCLSCERKFPAGVRECPYCGIELVEIAAEAESEISIEPGSREYHLLISGLSEWKAQMIAQSLEEDGIPCIRECSASTIGPEILGTMGPCYGLMVRESDIERAREILEEFD